jgi:hypothetical protein
MAERRAGAGHHLSGVLERSTPPKTVTPAESPEIEDIETAAIERPGAEATPTAKGREASRPDREPSRKALPAGKATKKAKGRTIYLTDDLFERIIVQAHRRDKTISEYVAMILDRHVPDHRMVRADTADEAGAV